MEIKTSYAAKFHLPEQILKEYYCPQLTADFSPSDYEREFCESDEIPSLISVDLYKVLDWLHGSDLPKPLEKEVCEIPVLLYVSDFSTQHLLFHYDGTPQSANLIKRYIALFSNLISDSKATIISPSFIPKSKIREEQEIIQLVSQSTRETSFIKFNFSRIGDFWSYAVKQNCTLLVTTKEYQADLAKVLFHFYKGKMWSSRLSFYLSV
ncbi:MAG: hypothetical protein ACQEW9_08000 [Bacteroidota bacterium]|uniref:Uncharacterized protein n=1 Tax=Algoriphagus faecimaris TaxID=686796 RepID=A0A1G6SGW9_9BACT|nr:hypothetical protein [Algoriphagus faecimaris]SDD15881.1 hypothetical protein SAMN04488104_10171 [Algoriphagus faecimaris]